MKKIKLYMDIAERVALESYCERKKVGAVIVKDNNIISFGYNGTISGFPNVCEADDGEKTLETVLHAESNALMKCLKRGESTDGASLYVTLSPCQGCAKLIIQSGIKEVFYRDEYRSISGLDLLCEANVKLTQLISD
jgi:dCMP deaminase